LIVWFAVLEGYFVEYYIRNSSLLDIFEIGEYKGCLYDFPLSSELVPFAKEQAASFNEDAA
jgi:hypothetical protein